MNLTEFAERFCLPALLAKQPEHLSCEQEAGSFICTIKAGQGALMEELHTADLCPTLGRQAGSWRCQKTWPFTGAMAELQATLHGPVSLFSTPQLACSVKVCMALSALAVHPLVRGCLYAYKCSS